MDAQDVSTLDEGQRVDDGGAVERLLGGDAEQLAYHALAADANQDGHLESLKTFEAVEYSVVLVYVLAETEASGRG